MAILSKIYNYPLKSGQANKLLTADVGSTGLAFDRYFVVTDLKGKFITGRTKSQLVKVNTNIEKDMVTFSAPHLAPITFNLATLLANYKTVTVWGDEINAQHCNNQIDKWFSKFLNTPCQLYFLGNKSARTVVNTKQPLSFADGYPLLIISRASLDALNERSPQKIEMLQFRPNLVIDGCEAFAEDGWHRIRIGNVDFELATPCSRCIFTTVDPNTGKRSDIKEPINTLAQFRKDDSGEIFFGQNLIALNKGTISAGDMVTIIKTRQAIVYPDTGSLK